MPPAYALGFHFSKWADLTGNTIIERDSKFTKNKFPVDVLWMDLDYTKDNQYFVFND